MSHTIRYGTTFATRGGSATLRDRLTIQLARQNKRKREMEYLADAGLVSPARVREERLQAARLTELIQVGR